MIKINFTLPWPPTANHLFPTVKNGRRVLSSEAKQYRKRVGENVLIQRVPRHTLSGELALWLYLRPPREYNVGDIANREKALVDALEHTGVIANDKFIRELHLVRECACPPHGEVGVMLYEIRTYFDRENAA